MSKGKISIGYLKKRMILFIKHKLSEYFKDVLRLSKLAIIPISLGKTE